MVFPSHDVSTSLASYIEKTAISCFWPYFSSILNLCGPLWDPKPPIVEQILIICITEHLSLKHLVKFQDFIGLIYWENCHFVFFSQGIHSEYGLTSWKTPSFLFNIQQKMWSFSVEIHYLQQKKNSELRI